MKQFGVVKVFRTLQGEGALAGHAAVFVRFAGCNLWTGLPATRAYGRGACSRWCDTEFHSGVAQLMSESELREQIIRIRRPRDIVVFTGGEPLLQLNHAPGLVSELNDAFTSAPSVHIETNGTLEAHDEINRAFITVSPKLDHEGRLLDYALVRADQVKVVWPGTVPGVVGWDLDKLRAVQERWSNARHFYIQPQDPIRGDLIGHSALVGGGADLLEMHASWTEEVVDIAKNHSPWKMGVQLHKLAGLE